MSHCKNAFDHEPETTCPECKLEVDQYGNTCEDFDYCSFPDCGCDGARLCMAKKGPSDNARGCNVEGMYDRKDPEAQKAKMDLLKLCYDRNKT